MNRGAAHSAFHDLLLILLLSVFAMLIIAALSMRPPTEPATGPDRKAEILIEMAWPDMSLDDLDLWVLLPDRRTVSYRNRDVSGVSLDRDDTNGLMNSDWYEDDSGTRQVLRANRETVAIRAPMPGRYVVNTQIFMVREGIGQMVGVPLPYGVQVKILDLNPAVRNIVAREVIVAKLAEQRTAVSFTLTPDGDVVDIDTEEQVPFIAIGGVQ